LPAHILESELFGYGRGAFTGANTRRAGAFQRADGGTLFLDELGELSLTAQASLLRALGGGGIRRMGGFEIEYPDVRIIAATNRDLVGLIRRRRFREDLFFRLETLFVKLPPLRDREGDIEMLARQWAKKTSVEASITAEAMALLKAHRWPGNIRELQNVIRRAILTRGNRIEANHLFFHHLEDAPEPVLEEPEVLSEEEREIYKKNLDRKTIQMLLDRHNGNRAAVARALGMSRSTLIHRMKRLGF